MPATPWIWRLKQDCQEFEASLGDLEKLYQAKTKAEYGGPSLKSQDSGSLNRITTACWRPAE